MHAADLSGMIRDLTAELMKKSADAAEFRTRLELTAQAESTLREALERERQRADWLKTELQEARKSLLAPRDASEATTAETESRETPDQREGSQEGGERRSWWRRFFGFE